MILILTVISILLFYTNTPPLIILTINIMLLILFTILGWVNLWVILVLAVVIFVFTLLKLINKGGN